MSTIDDQVAAFADELEGIAAFDPDRIAIDVQDLAAALVNAPDHDTAAVAMREFIDARPDDAPYAKAVTIAALTQFALHVALTAPIPTLDGDTGLLRRMKRLTYAARGLGLSEVI